MEQLANKGMVYREDEGDFSIYEYWLDGRVVLEAAVNKTDPEFKIFVGPQGATFAHVQLGADSLTETTGRAYLKSDGSRINGLSVANYFTQRRIARTLANIYVSAAVKVEPTEDEDED